MRILITGAAGYVGWVLIDALQARYNIDPRRVYADGLSNGGGMAFVLSCTLSDRIAAVGLVGSAQLLPWEWCQDERPVPMVNFHGTADRFTSVARLDNQHMRSWAEGKDRQVEANLSGVRSDGRGLGSRRGRA